AFDPRDPGAVLRPIAGFWNVHWDAIAVRRDGQIVAFRQATPTAFATADVIDAASGRVIDRVTLTSANHLGTTPWIDFDSSGRYLLYTDQNRGLRWTDFNVVGTIGTGLHNAGW